ncbi:hypothetical protein AB0D11_41955 [Streptomyces monashensis]|uniref:hypothetical protein n=1 Tax=Streptomyces monashensis TaxID=1678012 RepID=UPI0033D72DE3
MSWAAVLLAPLLGRHADGWAGIGWGVVAAVFTAVLPTLILRLGEHRQYWGDRHVRRRQDRIVAAPGVMTSVITGTALLYGLDAPVEVTALVAAMVAVLLALLVIAFFWKVSVHSAVASGALTSLATVFGPWLLVLASVVLLIGWSCIRLRCHTVGPGQRRVPHRRGCQLTRLRPREVMGMKPFPAPSPADLVLVKAEELAEHRDANARTGAVLHLTGAVPDLAGLREYVTARLDGLPCLRHVLTGNGPTARWSRRTRT